MPLVANETRCETFATEEIIFMKGSIGTKFFVILRGGCEAYTSQEADGEETMITKLVGSS